METTTPRIPGRLTNVGRGALAAVGPPAAVSLLAVGDAHRRTTVALLFVIAVVVSTVLGGQRAGLIAALLSFLSLNYFFTVPINEFNVDSPAALVAPVVFLFVSISVGTFVARSVDQRRRAERRELELGLMNRLMASLLSGEDVRRVLERHGDEINSMLRSSRCVISTDSGDNVDLRTEETTDDRPPYRLQLKAREQNVGQMSVWPAHGSLPPTDELRVIQAFGNQLALALEGVRLSEEVKRTEMESQAHALKASIFAGVTHDVKTPLAAITASVTSLLEGQGFTLDQNREHAEMIKEEAERLHRVVNDLLDIGRLQAGAHLPLKERVAVEEVLESLVARMRPSLKGRELVVRVAENLPDVNIDIVQIDRVLTSLIDNALKFSPPSSPLDLSATRTGDKVQITVADSGPGVSKEVAQVIFEPFHKSVHHPSGTGLGLAIAQAIVTAHGGSIWVDRSPTGGAAFTFDLPLDIEIAPKEVIEPSTNAF